MAANNGKEWGFRILILITSLALGFGISQITLAGQVRENTTNIDNIKYQITRIENKIDWLIQQEKASK